MAFRISEYTNSSMSTHPIGYGTVESAKLSENLFSQLDSLKERLRALITTDRIAYPGERTSSSTSQLDLLREKLHALTSVADPLPAPEADKLTMSYEKMSFPISDIKRIYTEFLSSRSFIEKSYISSRLSSKDLDNFCKSFDSEITLKALKKLINERFGNFGETVIDNLVNSEVNNKKNRNPTDIEIPLQSSFRYFH